MNSKNTPSPSDFNPSDYEKHRIFQIEQWKTKEPDAVSRFADAILAPVNWVVSQVIPESAMMGALNLGNAAGQLLSRVQTIKYYAKINDYKDLRERDLDFCDGLAQGEQNWAMGLAAAEGGGTGWMGLPGIAIDAPAIVSFALRSIHLMGLCYGYEMKTEKDKEIVFAIMSASGANSMKEKLAALTTLRMFQVTIQRETWKLMAEKAATNAFSQQAVLLSSKKLAKQLGINLTKRKMAQAVPVVGAIVGATVNAWYVSDVCWAARRTFQERWLRDNGKWIDADLEEE